MKRTILYLGCAIMAALSSCTEKGTTPDNPEPTAVTVTEVTNLTPTFIGGVAGVEAGDELEKDGTISLVLTPGEVLMSGFSAVHVEHIHVHVGDNVYMPSFPETTEEYVQSLTMEIPVPEESTGIIVAYAVQQQLTPDGFTMSLEDNEDGIVLYGVSPEQKYKYFDCYLRTPDAYTIESVEFKMGDDEWKDITSVSGCGFSRSESLDWVYEVSVRPEYQDVTGDVLLRVKGSQHARYKITWKNTEFVRTDIPEEYEQNYFPAESIDGETVTASFWTKDGYYLDGATSNVEGLELQCLYRSYVRFTMPASDVEITLDFKEMIPVSYEESAHISAAQLYDANDIYYGVPIDVAIPGEYVYLFANAEDGYKPSVALNDAGESFEFVIYGDGIDRYSYYAQVHIPEGATSATVRAEAVKVYTASGGSEIYFNNGKLWAPGEQVSFQVAVPEGQKIKSVSVEQTDGTPVECTMDNAYGSFTMPESDVYVSAEFEALDAGTQAHVSAVYNMDEYGVYCQTNPYYQEIDEEGFDVPVGTTLYFNVQGYYGMPFWVGIKIGETEYYFEAEEDPDFGDVSFGRSFVISADTVIKVGDTRNSVQF